MTKQIEDKGNELMKKYYDEVKYAIDQNDRVIMNVAKQCAIICCEEFINAMSATRIGYCKEPFNAYYKTKKEFWQQVKSYIQSI